MTPHIVLDAAEAVLSEVPPRGWLDCALAVDMILRRAGGPSCLGDYVGAYQSPAEAARLIRMAGGWSAHFTAVVGRNGWRPGPEATGAIGHAPNLDAVFGHVCGVCIRPGAWVVPALGGWTVLNSMEAVCRYS